MGSNGNVLTNDEDNNLKKETKKIDYSRLNDLWNDSTEENWKNAKMHYWNIKSVRNNVCLECKLSKPEFVREQIINDFYRFIKDDFLVWKYSGCYAKNKQMLLNKWTDSQKTDIKKFFILYCDRLQSIERLDDKIIIEGIKLKNHIEGVGVAGITGLLSLIAPEKFGTVDRFVASAMEELGLLNGKIRECSNISIKEAIEMEHIMINKANELNNLFGHNDWRPRDIDMILWSYGRDEV